MKSKIEIYKFRLNFTIILNIIFVHLVFLIIRLSDKGMHKHYNITMTSGVDEEEMLYITIKPSILIPLSSLPDFVIKKILSTVTS